MKAILTLLAPAVLLAGPSVAKAAEGALEVSLAQATRQAMSVAPWVKVRIGDAVAAGDQMIWMAGTSGGQRYRCSAEVGVELSTGKVTCARLAASPAQRLAVSERYKVRTAANLQSSQARRAITPVDPSAWAAVYY
jgi:hypothetical protein